MPYSTADLEQAAWRLTPSRLAARLTAGRYQRWGYIERLSHLYADALAGVHPRQIWMLPPQHGKSEIASRWGPVWALDWWPHLRVILASYAAELAEGNGRMVRNTLVEHSGILRARLTEDSKAAHRWNTPEGGGLLATGVGGIATGFPGDLVVVDDPFKNWQEAHSAVVREAVWNWWLTVIRTRLGPNAAVIVVQTRWHEDDLAGRLEAQDQAGEGDGWLTVRLPALAQADDPLGRPPGAALCPARYDTPYLEQTRTVLGSYLFGALYQQSPSPPEGGLLKRHWWQWWAPPGDPAVGLIVPTPAGVPPSQPVRGLPPLDRVVASWDMTWGRISDSADMVVGQVWGASQTDRFLLDQTGPHRMTFPETLVAVRELASRWPQASQHLVEATGNGPDVIRELRHVVAGLTPVTPKGSKEVRVHAVSGTVESGQVYLPLRSSWTAGLVDEAAAFPTGAHDDQVDAFSQALNRLASGGPTSTNAAELAKARLPLRLPPRQPQGRAWSVR